MLVLTAEQIRAAARALKAVQMKPRCDNHRPRKTKYGVQCPNCYFTMYDLSKTVRKT